MSDQQGRLVRMNMDRTFDLFQKILPFFNDGISNVLRCHNHRYKQNQTKQKFWKFFILQGNDCLDNYTYMFFIPRGHSVGRENLRCKENTFFAHRNIKTYFFCH